MYVTKWKYTHAIWKPHPFWIESYNGIIGKGLSFQK